jgi:hypothetical protein
MATKTMYPASESKQSYIKDGEFKRQVVSNSLVIYIALVVLSSH